MRAIEVDSAGYVDAVGQLAEANRAVVSAMNTLTDTLYSSGSMAGSDAGGTEWAQSYDPAAAQLVQAGCTMGDALASMANLLNGSLANHAGADHASMIYPGEPESAAAAAGDPNPAHDTESLYAPAPPSAAGGIGGEPSWWHWIAGHLEGLLWPDANTDQLRAAGSAWQKAGSTIADQQYALYSAEGALSQIRSPEMDQVDAAFGQMVTHLGDLGAMFTQVGQACTQYAADVDRSHQEISDQLKSFIEWSIAIEAGGAILSEIGGEIAGQFAEGAEIDSAAGKVIKILSELIELARTVKTAIDTAVEAVGELIAKLGKFVSARLVTALEKAGAALTKDELGHLPAWVDGGPIPTDGPLAKLFEGYDKYGGMSRKEFMEEYWDPTLRDGQGGWRYPTAKDGFPDGFDGPAVPNTLKQGDTLDRIGRPGGDYAAPNGTPYGDRALPPSNIRQPYTQYRVVKPLPADVTEGKTAAWFGQAGGGMQYYFPGGIAKYIPEYLEVVR